MNAKNEKQLLNVKEVAAELAVSTRTVWRRVADGCLARPEKVSVRAVRWRREGVDEYLRQLNSGEQQ